MHFTLTYSMPVQKRGESSKSLLHLKQDDDHLVCVHRSEVFPFANRNDDFKGQKRLVHRPALQDRAYTAQLVAGVS